VFDPAAFDALWEQDRNLTIDHLGPYYRSDYVRAHLLRHFGGLGVAVSRAVRRSSAAPRSAGLNTMRKSTNTVCARSDSRRRRSKLRNPPLTTRIELRWAMAVEATWHRASWHFHHQDIGAALFCHITEATTPAGSPLPAPLVHWDGAKSVVV
jgi:hypothetical protein